MRYAIVLAPEAIEDLNRLKANVRPAIRTALETHLRHEPRKTTRSPTIGTIMTDNTGALASNYTYDWKTFSNNVTPSPPPRTKHAPASLPYRTRRHPARRLHARRRIVARALCDHQRGDRLARSASE